MKSFIPWVGGKSLLAKRIIAEFPESFSRYIEVFGGGASVLFAQESSAKLEVYNDADSQLVNLFRCVKFHRQELQREISHWLNSREMFYDIRERLDLPGFTDIQRTAMFYVQVRISFGSDRQAFGCDRKNLSCDYLEKIEQRLKNVVIEHKDFRNLIEVYDRPDALFYCDPPYHNSEKYYDKLFSESDHEQLCEMIISGIFTEISALFQSCYKKIHRVILTLNYTLVT